MKFVERDCRVRGRRDRSLDVKLVETTDGWLSGGVESVIASISLMSIACIILDGDGRKRIGQIENYLLVSKFGLEKVL